MRRVWQWLCGAVRRLLTGAAGPDQPAYQSPPGRHRHQCPACHSVWEHGNDSETRAAHRCPACSHLKLPGPWEWYEGPRGPDYNSKGHPLPASWPV
jgi:hypothetical protein